MSIKDLVDVARGRPDVVVDPPNGLPAVRVGEELPPELVEFYSLCGGMTLFAGTPDEVRIHGPDTFLGANEEVIGCAYPDDISHTWYMLARSGLERASIDCSPVRAGRCYDSFWDCHGVAGSCSIIAWSFAEFLELQLAVKEATVFWSEPGFRGFGDAYEEIPEANSG
jgi:hypothetical protein